MSLKVVVVALISLLFIKTVRSQSDELLIEGQTGNLHLQHTVVAKENWYSIGRLYNLNPKELAPYNKLDMAKPLSIGQEVKIPLTAVNFSQNGVKAAGETLVPLYHIVQEKEWLYRISVNHNKVPIANLEKWNNINKDQVRAGMHLIVGYLKVKTALSALATKSSGPAVAGKPGGTGTVKTEGTTSSGVERTTAKTGGETSAGTEGEKTTGSDKTVAGDKKGGSDKTVAGNKIGGNERTIGSEKNAGGEKTTGDGKTTGSEKTVRTEKNAGSERTAASERTAGTGGGKDTMTHAKAGKTGETEAVKPYETGSAKTEGGTTAMTGNVKPVSAGGKSFDGGFFKYDYSDGGKSASGLAGIFKSTSGWQDGKYYALMNNVPVGTIVKITGSTTGKTVYAKVLGQLPDMKESAGLTIRISNAAASELGEGDGKFNVDVRY